MLELTPSQRFELTDSMCQNHADHCPVCSPPSIERSWAGCREGRRLDQQLLRDSRAVVDALADRRRR